MAGDTVRAGGVPWRAGLAVCVAAAISSVMAGWVADATGAHMVCPSLALAGLSGAALV
ncbi:MAG TPA: hypothetical protein VK741_15060 [Acetobacteraceae bacterium]|nr:hypothetical protein [Acetobacteraceae bacterium]